MRVRLGAEARAALDRVVTAFGAVTKASRDIKV